MLVVDELALGIKGCACSQLGSNVVAILATLYKVMTGIHVVNPFTLQVRACDITVTVSYFISLNLFPIFLCLLLGAAGRAFTGKILANAVPPSVLR